MPPPPLWHALCHYEVTQMFKAIANPEDNEVHDWLISIYGEEATLGTLPRAAILNALFQKWAEVMDGSIAVELWAEHSLDPWPMPPYPGSP